MPHPAEKLSREGARPIVVSRSMTRVFSTIERLASSVVPVLILGETGTGKEVVARAIHDGGGRARAPFVCVNCGALPESLVEGTLFGHERGAFTGASEKKLGVFEAASGGTVFLDEIGELPSPAQASLLRVLETKRITRVGGVEEHPVDVRILAATHRDLEGMCERGMFRWDLYYRLNVLSLSLPPLRTRAEDVEPLAFHFMKAAAEANGRPVRQICDDALRRLVSYEWPGNVRELKNVIERAVVIAASDTIEVEDLPEPVKRSLPEPRGHASETGSLALAEPPAEDLRAELSVAVSPRPTEPGDSGEATEDLGIDGPILDYKTQMQQAERRVLLAALHRADLNQTEAARLLQMPLRTLVHKIKVLGLREDLTRMKAARTARSGRRGIGGSPNKDLDPKNGTC